MRRTAMAISMACLAFLTGCGSDDATSVDATPEGEAAADKYPAYRTACVDRINAFRATEGLPALHRWADGESCADGEAKSDAETGKAHGVFGTCGEWAQNECPGWGSVASTVDGCLQAMWDEKSHPGGEQGHYRNMSNKSYTRVAFGFYETPGGKVWALQNFK